MQFVIDDAIYIWNLVYIEPVMSNDIWLWKQNDQGPIMAVRRTVITLNSLLDTMESKWDASHIRRILVGNTIVDHWDVIEALPASAAPTTFVT